MLSDLWICGIRDAMNWNQVLDQAIKVVDVTLRALPPPLRTQAESIPITFERRPARALAKSGVASDTMGLFVGNTFTEEGESGGDVPTQIILYLENIWEEAEADMPEYKRQVKLTLLHEIGHYLGLEEEDLIQRDLE